MIKTTVICFGEILWDVFPDKKVIGGAPLNVALRLHSFGVPVKIVSSIGQDNLGKEISAYVQKCGLPLDFIQTDEELATGAVTVTLNEAGSASYVINKPVAWDAIELSPELILAVGEAPFFLFGSLAARGAMNRHTLQALLEVANTRIFDVNLRKPDYDISMVYELMQKADVVKLNDEELEEVCVELGCQDTNLNDQIGWLSKISHTKTVCVTKGGEGAVLFFNNKFYENEGFNVEVADTVGAGDSFLATLIKGLLIDQKHPSEALERACAVGALVASKEGANCNISGEEIKQFVQGV